MWYSSTLTQRIKMNITWAENVLIDFYGDRQDFEEFWCYLIKQKIREI